MYISILCVSMTFTNKIFKIWKPFIYIECRLYIYSLINQPIGSCVFWFSGKFPHLTRVLSWTERNQNEPNWTKLLSWTKLNRTEPNWTEQTEPNWTEYNGCHKQKRSDHAKVYLFSPPCTRTAESEFCFESLCPKNVDNKYIIYMYSS